MFVSDVEVKKPALFLSFRTFCPFDFSSDPSVHQALLQIKEIYLLVLLT